MAFAPGSPTSSPTYRSLPQHLRRGATVRAGTSGLARLERGLGQAATRQYHYTTPLSAQAFTLALGEWELLRRSAPGGALRRPRLRREGGSAWHILWQDGRRHLQAYLTYAQGGGHGRVELRLRTRQHEVLWRLVALALALGTIGLLYALGQTEWALTAAGAFLLVALANYRRLRLPDLPSEALARRLRHELEPALHLTRLR